MYYRVKEVADMAGVSVRTLHHYDHIDLLKPESLSESGYRLYGSQDLARLQQILFYRELGFSLMQIKTVIDSPDFDRVSALKAHRESLIKKRARLDRLVETVEKTIKSVEEGTHMSAKEMFEGFDMAQIEAHQKKYAKEAEERWGGSEAYKRSQESVSKYTESDWARIVERQKEIFDRFISLMDRDPADPEVQSAVEEWRQHLTSNFYDCTPEILRGLGEMYVSDSRFTESIDTAKPGLADFMSKAIRVYCDQH